MVNRDRVKEAVAQALFEFDAQPDGSYRHRLDLVPAPICILDLESSDLMKRRSGDGSYANVLSNAVMAIRDHITPEEIQKVIAVIKVKRANACCKNVRRKIGKPELIWIENTAESMSIRPARVLEALLYIYLRVSIA